MSSTPQDPSGSQPPQWNPPGQQSGQQSGQYPSYPGASQQHGQQYGGQYGGGQGGYGQYGGDMKRPGGVTAAAWITIIMSGLSGALWLLSGLALALAGDNFADEIRQEPDVMAELDRAGISSSQLEDGVVGFGIAAIVIGIIMLLFVLAGVGLLRGSNAARIIVVIGAVITILLGLLLIGSVISGLWVLAGIAVIVLLFVGDANRWFQSKKR